MDDAVVICVPPLKELEVLPEQMDLDILYEDEDVILINKQKIWLFILVRDVIKEHL